MQPTSSMVGLVRVSSTILTSSVSVTELGADRKLPPEVTAILKVPSTGVDTWTAVAVSVISTVILVGSTMNWPAAAPI